jgi:hypothetical protein
MTEKNHLIYKKPINGWSPNELKKKKKKIN